MGAAEALPARRRVGRLKSPEDQRLVHLGTWLRGQGYRFTTVTPATHARVRARPSMARARTLRDVFGWSCPFEPGLLPDFHVQTLREAGLLGTTKEGLLTSGVRFSSLGDQLFMHSAWPTTEQDSVFFGPDTYRFARFLAGVPGEFGRCIDIGAGSGAGLLSMGRRCHVRILADINPKALRFAAINAEINRLERPLLRQTSILDGIEGEFDLVVSNPPFLVDDSERAYRHGGARGIELSVKIVQAALPKLAPGGVLALYTATPVVAGEDLFRTALEPLLRDFDGTHEYEEVDVDVFGEELERESYADVDRIAVVTVLARRK